MWQKMSQLFLILSGVVKSSEKRILSDIDKDISLETDKILNSKILQFLGEFFNYPILSEEIDQNLNFLDFEDYYWIIDPLDGTLNYSRGTPLCSISIALWKKNEPILGAISDFSRDELFYGVLPNDLGLETGCWLNNTPIQTANIEKPSKAVVATGFPSWRQYDTESLSDFMKKVQQWKKVRLLGSAALSMAWVAAGRFDAYIEEDIRIWDVAAGAVLIKAAGGDISIIPNERVNFVTAIGTNGNIPVSVFD